MTSRKNDPSASLPCPASRRAGAEHVRAFTISTLSRMSRSGRSYAAPVPYLRMSGRWLEAYGFTRGCRILVAGEQGRIVLTLAEARTSAAG